MASALLGTVGMWLRTFAPLAVTSLFTTTGCSVFDDHCAHGTCTELAAPLRREPRVATFQSRTLVAWETDTAIDGRWLDETESVRLLDRIPNGPLAVATDGADALFAWSEQSAVWIQLASAAAPTKLADLAEEFPGVEPSVVPEVAFDGTSYAVAWPTGVTVARVARDGTVAGIASADLDAGEVAVAVDPAGLVIAWTRRTPRPDGNLASRVEVGRAPGVAIAAIDGGTRARLACSALGCVVAAATSATEITVQRLDPQLHAIDSTTVAASPQLGDFTLAGSQARYAVAWNNERTIGGVASRAARVFDGASGPIQLVAPSEPHPGETVTLPGQRPALIAQDATFELLWQIDGDRREADTIYERSEIEHTSLQRDRHTPVALFP